MIPPSWMAATRDELLLRPAIERVTVLGVRTGGQVALAIVVLCLCAGCSTDTGPSSSSGSTDSTASPSVSTSVTSVSATSQLSDMVKWQLTNKTAQPQLVTCEVLVLNGSTQLGELGPLQLAVAAGATAEQFSEVTTLAGSTASDTAQVLCQKD